jgi:hypothetical protein
MQYTCRIAVNLFRWLVRPNSRKAEIINATVLGAGQSGLNFVTTAGTQERNGDNRGVSANTTTRPLCKREELWTYARRFYTARSS